MENMMEFDAKPLFRTAADDLLRLHGDAALEMADQAVAKMKNLGHDEGLLIWLGIQAAIAERIVKDTDTVSHSVH